MDPYALAWNILHGFYIYIIYGRLLLVKHTHLFVGRLENVYSS